MLQVLAVLFSRGSSHNEIEEVFLLDQCNNPTALEKCTISNLQEVGRKDFPKLVPEKKAGFPIKEITSYTKTTAESSRKNKIAQAKNGGTRIRPSIKNTSPLTSM